MNFGKNSKNVVPPQIYFKQCVIVYYLVGLATDAQIVNLF